jgi:hypothetical protein
MVEMLVALVFVMILMAGMTKVFQASLNTFYTAGEKLSSSRRNRMAIDLLYDDLNTAGMSLVDITSPLPSGTANPAFCVIPNVLVTSAGADDPATTDELYMAFDQPLPFEGTLTSGGGSVTGTTKSGATAGDKVLLSGSMVVGTDNQYVIDCKDPVYAASVKAGMSFHIKDNLSHQALAILAPTVSGSTVTVTTAVSPSLGTQVTGRGDPGALRNERRAAGAGVVFILPQQMVRYRIMMLSLDPDTTNKPNGIPCLVREQGVFDSSKAFVPDTALTQVITENVAGFKVYLSADSGQTWAGSAVTDTGLDSGWTSGIMAALNTQIKDLGSKNYTDTSDPAWYRNIPVLVRLDITTRTAGKRLEYSSAADQALKKADYKDFTQSLVIVPRHFGLPLN